MENLKKVLVILILLCLFPFAIQAAESKSKHEQFSKVKIFIPAKSKIQELAGQGIYIDHAYISKNPGGGFDLVTELSIYQLELLQETDTPFEVLIKDVSEFYADRAKISQAEIKRIENSDNIDGFELGSMGGMYTFDEAVTELDSMRLLYPHLISEKISIGASQEGRDLWMVKISDNPDVDEDEPEVFYDALHHSNEPTALMTLMYYMNYLLENHGSDPEATFLVNNREMYFVPVVNPDGYVYNEQENPDGGGTWRKNRRDNGFGIYGVDLNRNYGYMWGYDNEGSSPLSFMGNYRGPSAFSEPEAQTVRDFCNERQFILSLSYHAYSNVIITPWSYETDLLTSDSLTFFDYGTEMTRDNFYIAGTPNQTVGYVGNGVSIDWQYGEQASKDKILAFGAEVGSEEDGTWPAPDRIIPLALDNLQSNLFLAWAGGGLVNYLDYKIGHTGDGDLYAEPGETVKLVCSVKNNGQGAAQNISISLLSDDPYVTIEQGGPFSGIEVSAGSIVESDSFIISLSSTTPEGYRPAITCEVDQGGVIRSSDLNGLIIGTPVLVFSDDAESGTGNWDLGEGWGLSANNFSPDWSFCDSPDGKYGNEINNAMTLADAVSLPDADVLYLEFRMRYDIERQDDFARVQISINGTDWETQQGFYTIEGSGSGVQPAGEQGYDFYEPDWMKEQIDLSSYLENSHPYLRFILTSDVETAKDGWYVDDIKMLAYEQEPSAISTEPDNLPGEFSLLQNYPNPFNPTTVIGYHVETRHCLVSTESSVHVELTVYNLLGQKVATLVNKKQEAGYYSVTFNSKDLATGIYVYKIKAGSFTAVRKMILMK